MTLRRRAASSEWKQFGLRMAVLAAMIIFIVSFH